MYICTTSTTVGASVSRPLGVHIPLPLYVDLYIACIGSTFHAYAFYAYYFHCAYFCTFIITLCVLPYHSYCVYICTILITLCVHLYQLHFPLCVPRTTCVRLPVPLPLCVHLYNYYHTVRISVPTLPCVHLYHFHCAYICTNSTMFHVQVLYHFHCVYSCTYITILCVRRYLVQVSALYLHYIVRSTSVHSFHNVYFCTTYKVRVSVLLPLCAGLRTLHRIWCLLYLDSKYVCTTYTVRTSNPLALCFSLYHILCAHHTLVPLWVYGRTCLYHLICEY